MGSQIEKGLVVDWFSVSSEHRKSVLLTDTASVLGWPAGAGTGSAVPDPGPATLLAKLLNSLRRRACRRRKHFFLFLTKEYIHAVVPHWHRQPWLHRCSAGGHPAPWAR